MSSEVCKKGSEECIFSYENNIILSAQLLWPCVYTSLILLHQRPVLCGKLDIEFKVLSGKVISLIHYIISHLACICLSDVVLSMMDAPLNHFDAVR